MPGVSVFFQRSQAAEGPSYEQTELLGRAQVLGGPSFGQSALGGGKQGIDQSVNEPGRYLRLTTDDQTYDPLGLFAQAAGYDETLDLYSRSSLRASSRAASDISYAQTLLGSSKYGVDETASTIGRYYFAAGVAASSEAACSPNSISSEESVGAPHFNVVQTVAPGSVVSEESLGSPVLVQEQFVGPSPIESAEAVGSPAPGFPQPVDSILTAEAFGQPSIAGGRPPLHPPVRPPHQPGQGSIWFDHVPFAPVETRQYLGANLAEFSGLLMQITVGESLLLLMGGPQFNGFIVPEVRASDVELVPVAYAGSGGAGRRVMY